MLCRDDVQAELAPVTVAAVRCDQSAPKPQCEAVFPVLAANAKLVSELATPAGLRVAPGC